MCSSATGRQIQLTAQAPKQNLSAETRRMRLVLDWESAASWEQTRAGLVAGPEAVIAQGVRYVRALQHCWFAWPGIQVRMSGRKCQGLSHALPFSASPVVYEHRSRLERSLQKERGEHKKTKEGKSLAEQWPNNTPAVPWGDAHIAPRAFSVLCAVCGCLGGGLCSLTFLQMSSV